MAKIIPRSCQDSYNMRSQDPGQKINAMKWSLHSSSLLKLAAFSDSLSWSENPPKINKQKVSARIQEIQTECPVWRYYVLLVARRQKPELKDYQNFTWTSKWLFIGVREKQKEICHPKDINPTSNYLNYWLDQGELPLL